MNDNKLLSQKQKKQLESYINDLNYNYQKEFDNNNLNKIEKKINDKQNI